MDPLRIGQHGSARGASASPVRSSYAKSAADKKPSALMEEETMNRLILAALIASVSVGSAVAQSCSTKAVSKEGKPLAGAAKTSFVKKCCEDSAVSKDGKPLSGAAKNSYVKKCMTE
jgi:hypothetical protein